MDISGLDVRELLALHLKVRDRLRELKPDLSQVGLDIYAVLHPTKLKRVEFQALVPDKLYSPSEVAEILSVSYNTALRLMESSSKTVDLAKPRTRKRLLRIKGKHLKEYIDGKLK